jgi:hypothetical protein
VEAARPRWEVSPALVRLSKPSLFHPVVPKSYLHGRKNEAKQYQMTSLSGSRDFNCESWAATGQEKRRET